MVFMKRHSVSAAHTYKKQKPAVQQGSPRAVPLSARRVIAPADQQSSAKISNLLPLKGDIATRVPPAQQNQIVRLYLEEGRNISEISREVHRDRATVTKIVNDPQVQEALASARARLLGYADRWVDSLNYAVDTEQDGALAFKLLERFGVIPGPPPKVIGAGQAAQPGQDYADQPILDEDPIFQDMKKACAYEIGRVAMERHDVYGSSLPAEMEELEAMVTKRRNEQRSTQKE
jgi:hypothetical protein